MKNPLITIIIPVYNRPILVAECIDSLMGQTNPNWDLIVVDDGSTDNTWEVLGSYADVDNRIQILKRNRKPKGAPTCRNIGLELAKAKYVIFLDSDDILAPWAIESRIRFAEKYTSFDMLISNGIEFDNSNMLLRRERANFGVKDLLEYHLNYQAAWQTSCALWNKIFIKKIGGWHEHSQSSQDSILHLIALYNGAIVKWGDEVPDVFIRVEKGFEKISNTRSIEKIRSRLVTLDYVKSQLKLADYKKYEFYFLIDLLNRLEYLDNKTLRTALKQDIPAISEKTNIKKLHLYFWLYANTRQIPLIRSIVYRIRKYLIDLPRIENIREHSLIKEDVFHKLLQRAKEFSWIRDKVKVLE